jgi:hypothetical protein
MKVGERRKPKVPPTAITTATTTTTITTTTTTTTMKVLPLFLRFLDLNSVQKLIN